MVSSRVAAMLGERKTEKVLFDAIRFKRNQDLTKKRIQHSWEANSYKIYPSTIRSLTMCPKRYVEEDVHKPPQFGLDVAYRMEVGKALHYHMQNECLVIPELLYRKPDFSHVISDVSDMAAALQKKLDDVWPEVPIADTSTGISGRADLVLKVENCPVVVDIKTTSVEDFRKDKETGEWQENRWADYTKKLPSEDHKLQVSIYCYYMNKFQYYDKPIRQAGLAYLNLLMKSGEVAAEHEVYFDFTEELEAKVGELLKHLALERKAYMEKRETECTYPRCRAHHGGVK